MIRRREFIAGIGSAAVWPLVARAQQQAIPVIGLVLGGFADASAAYATAFRKGLGESGYVEGKNVTVEYYWLAGQYDVGQLRTFQRSIGQFRIRNSFRIGP